MHKPGWRVAVAGMTCPFILMSVSRRPSQFEGSIRRGRQVADPSCCGGPGRCWAPPGRLGRCRTRCSPSCTAPPRLRRRSGQLGVRAPCCYAVVHNPNHEECCTTEKLPLPLTSAGSVHAIHNGLVPDTAEAWPLVQSRRLVPNVTVVVCTNCGGLLLQICATVLAATSLVGSSVCEILVGPRDGEGYELPGTAEGPRQSPVVVRIVHVENMNWSAAWFTPFNCGVFGVRDLSVASHTQTTASESVLLFCLRAS